MPLGYITFGQIQRHIWDVRINEKRSLGFREAALELYHSGKHTVQRPDDPDFGDWDLTDMEQLRRLAWDMVICIDSLLLNEPFRALLPHPVQSDITVLELRQLTSSVRISLESVGSPPVFTSLPQHFVVLYILKGQGVLHAKNDYHRLQSGQLIVLAPGVPYYMECTPEDLVLDIIATKERFEKYFLDVVPQNTPLHGFFRRALYTSQKEYLLFSLPAGTALMRIVQNLFIESIARSEPYAEEAFLHWLQLFFVQLLRTPQPLPEPGESRQNPDRSALVTALLQHIQQYYATLTLENLAEVFHYNPTYLSRLIRRETGCTLMQLLTDCRLEAARHLLQNTELTVGEIAERVGYNNTDHFTVMFRRKTGMPPSAYRELLQGKLGCDAAENE